MFRTVRRDRQRGAGLAVLLIAASAPFLGGGAVAASSSGFDLRYGAVFSMSNDPAGNAVVAFARRWDGTLAPAGSYPTGGTGSGGFEDSANGLVLGSVSGESAPNNLQNFGDLLYATNAGSDNVSVFRVKRSGLELLEVEPSNVMKPVSITVNRGIAYVLNSGETIDGLVPPNCAEGALPSVTGFRVSKNGQLTPIPESTRTLSGDPMSGCAQVSFTPNGRVLVVTERTAKIAGQAPDDEGVINTFVVNRDGTLGEHKVYDATGEGPFGFTFNKRGALLTTEQHDGPLGVGLGTAAGYSLGNDGVLTASGPSVNNGGTDTCWFVVTDSGNYGFSSSFFADGRISSYRVRRNGALELIKADAGDDQVLTGASDLSLSRSSRYLYQLNSLEGTISAFRVGPYGALTRVDTVQAFPPSAMAAPLGLASS